MENIGSPAVAVLVCSSHVVVANCGDSCIMLSRGKEPVALSIDQKPDMKDERVRIKRMQEARSSDGMVTECPKYLVKCGSVIESSVKEEETSTSPSNKDVGNGDGSVPASVSNGSIISEYLTKTLPGSHFEDIFLDDVAASAAVVVSSDKPYQGEGWVGSVVYKNGLEQRVEPWQVTSSYEYMTLFPGPNRKACNIHIY